MVSLRPTIRPLEQVIAGLRSLSQGWAGHPSRSGRLLFLRSFAREPARGRIGAIMRWASRNAVCDPIALSWLKSAARGSSAPRTRSWPQRRSGRGWSAVARKPEVRAEDGRLGFLTACDHLERPPGFALVTSRWPNSTGAPDTCGPTSINHNACKCWHKQSGC